MSRDHARGKRIREAIAQKNVTKNQALAAELDVSAAAVSRWQSGGHLSLESACALAERLDVSLDWLLLGRGTIDWHRDDALSPSELQHVMTLRKHTQSVRALIVNLLEEIPARP
ncbi:helix-turn-helix domain-containing protein [Methylobacterium platani]|uniref:Transcriptional regulator n=2 Tax=Methylobacterium platani TaxID=427683 RepID=A0A179SLA3_9HYPH|nr:helix-turn-helix transcriptional regulator [Methylobacterium platani]KMO10680.1 hypothetical protein SQ03_29420 [Methylobacterium platani JCM 14648]OAS27273.1 transcriptional regulator [Methylobacterium platani]